MLYEVITPIKEFEGIDLEIGLVLEADTDDGEIIKATVTEVTKDIYELLGKGYSYNFV